MSKSEPSEYAAAKAKEDTFTYGVAALILATSAVTIVVLYLGSPQATWFSSSIAASALFAGASFFSALSLRSLLSFLETALKQQVEKKPMSYK